MVNPIVDIHMHVIPGVDDGSVDLAMSMEMLRASYDQGVRTIICTSHGDAYLEDAAHTREQFALLQEACKQELPKLRLYLGCEILCREYLMKTVLANLQNGTIPTMNGTKYVLAEYYPYYGIEFQEIKSCLQQLIDAGWTPIVAHTERYHQMFRTLPQVQELRDMGCLIQINAYSVEEEQSLATKEWVNEILQAGLADFIGTDAHRTTHRPPMVAKGVAAIYDRYGAEYGEAVCFRNAMKYLKAEID